MIPASRQRGGIGFLILLILAMTAVLGVFVVYQSMFGSQLSDQTGKLVTDLAGDALADSALEEGLAYIARQAKDPGSEIGEILRTEVFHPATGEVDLTGKLRLSSASDLTGSPPFRGFRLEDLEARILFQQPIEDNAYERWGHLRVRGTARGPERGKSVTKRRLESLHSFQVVMVSVPRPFDDLGLYLGRTRGILDLDWANAQRSELFVAMKELHAKLPQLRQNAPPDVVPEYDEMFDRMLSPEELEARLPPFPVDDQAKLSSLVFNPQAMNLATLSLSKNLAQEVQKRKEVYQQFEESLKNLASGTAEAHRQMLDALEALLGATDEVLLSLWTLQSGVRLHAPGQEDYQNLLEREPRLSLEHFRRKATCVLRPDPATGSVQGPFEAFLERYAPLSGVILVQGPSPPLVLKGSIPGQLVIVVEGIGAALEGVTSGTDPADELVIGVFGGVVTVEGAVKAALIVDRGPAPDGELGPETRVEIPEGARIEGALLMRSFSPESVLEGTITRNEVHHVDAQPTGNSSGIPGRKLWVAISPVPLRRHPIAP